MTNSLTAARTSLIVSNRATRRAYDAGAAAAFAGKLDELDALTKWEARNTTADGDAVDAFRAGFDDALCDIAASPSVELDERAAWAAVVAATPAGGAVLHAASLEYVAAVQRLSTARIAQAEAWEALTSSTPGPELDAAAAVYGEARAAVDALTPVPVFAVGDQVTGTSATASHRDAVGTVERFTPSHPNALSQTGSYEVRYADGSLITHSPRELVAVVEYDAAALKAEAEAEAVHAASLAAIPAPVEVETAEQIADRVAKVKHPFDRIGGLYEATLKGVRAGLAAADVEHGPAGRG